MKDRNCWLRNILDCGDDDLNLLDEIGLPVCDVIAEARNEGGTLSLDNVMHAVFRLAIENLCSALKCRLNELEEEGRDDSDEYFALCFLDPERDLKFYFNYICTEVFFAARGEIYHKYLSHALIQFEFDTGIPIQD